MGEDYGILTPRESQKEEERFRRVGGGGGTPQSEGGMPQCGGGVCPEYGSYTGLRGVRRSTG